MSRRSTRRDGGDRPPELPAPRPVPHLGPIAEDVEQYENVHRSAEEQVLTSRPHSEHSEGSEGFNDVVNVTGGEPSQAAILDAPTQGLHPLEPDIEVTGNINTVGDGSQETDPTATIETLAQVHSPPEADGAAGVSGNGGDIRGRGRVPQTNPMAGGGRGRQPPTGRGQGVPLSPPPRGGPSGAHGGQVGYVEREEGVEEAYPLPAGLFPGGAQGGRGFPEASDRASEIMATSETGIGVNGVGTPTAFNTEAFASEAHARTLEKANVYLQRISTLRHKVKKMAASVKAILEATSDADHSRSITIDSLAGYSALKTDYTDQICQVSNAMREEAWGHADLMGLADKADDALEEVMSRGI